ncbi:hypothetical protein STEG23_027205 [Scotinomys teguina]
MSRGCPAAYSVQNEERCVPGPTLKSEESQAKRRRNVGLDLPINLGKFNLNKEDHCTHSTTWSLESSPSKKQPRFKYGMCRSVKGQLPDFLSINLMHQGPSVVHSASGSI